MRIEVSINSQKIDKKLRKMAKSLDDMREYYETVALPRIIEHLKDIFRTGADGTWAKRLDNLPHKLLRKSGRLYRSYTSRASPDNITVIKKRVFEFGSSVPYAKYHEEGTRRMQAREITGFVKKRQLLSRSYVRSLNKYIKEKYDE